MKKEKITNTNLIDKDSDGLVDYLKLFKVIQTNGKRMTLDEFNTLKEPGSEWYVTHNLSNIVTFSIIVNVFSEEGMNHYLVAWSSVEEEVVFILPVTNVHYEHFDHKNSKLFSEGNWGSKVYCTLADTVILSFATINRHGVYTNHIYVEQKT